MADRGGRRGGRSFEQPVAVRRRAAAPAEPARARGERPPLPAFVVMGVSILLMLFSDPLQRALHTQGPLPLIVGIFLSGIGVMMLKPPGRR
jgi:hypothetical protein